jgi:hypothetical protein
MAGTGTIPNKHCIKDNGFYFLVIVLIQTIVTYLPNMVTILYTHSMKAKTYSTVFRCCAMIELQWVIKDNSYNCFFHIRTEPNAE